MKGFFLLLAGMLLFSGEATAQGAGYIETKINCIYSDADDNIVFNGICKAVWSKFENCTYKGAVGEVYVLSHQKSEMKIALGCDFTAAVNGIPANYKIDLLQGQKMILVRTTEGELFGFKKIGL